MHDKEQGGGEGGTFRFQLPISCTPIPSPSLMVVPASLYLFSFAKYYGVVPATLEICTGR